MRSSKPASRRPADRPTLSSLPALLGASFLALCALAAPSAAQDDVEAPAAAEEAPVIDFGDDVSPWAGDGDCDDPRFEGRGMAAGVQVEADRGHDAADCRAAFDGSRIRLRADAEAVVDPAELADASVAAPVVDLDFGDDTSQWAHDDECDDPRFRGVGVADATYRENLLRDAADCRAAYDAGDAVYDGELPPMWEGVFEGVDFGDNSGPSPDDDYCDDPRFMGRNVSPGLTPRNIGHDAHDCRTQVEAAMAVYTGELPAPFEGVHDDIDFGTNASDFAFDGECDDPRFEGSMVAFGAARAHMRADSQDCRAAYDAGEASYKGELPELFSGAADGVEYGDNAGRFVDDKECDDRRFSGPAVANRPSRDLVGHDAADCREAVMAGGAVYRGELPPLFEGVFEGVDYGDNAGTYPDDEECDDPRFRGHGMAGAPWSRDQEGHDAADCHALATKGFVRFVLADGLFEGEADGIDFGDNSGPSVNDGLCDDDRFEGPGMSYEPAPANARRDAFDCRLNWLDRSVILRE